MLTTGKKLIFIILSFIVGLGQNNCLAVTIESLLSQYRQDQLLYSYLIKGLVEDPFSQDELERLDLIGQIRSSFQGDGVSLEKLIFKDLETLKGIKDVFFKKLIMPQKLKDACSDNCELLSFLDFFLENEADIKTLEQHEILENKLPLINEILILAQRTRVPLLYKGIPTEVGFTQERKKLIVELINASIERLNEMQINIMRKFILVELEQLGYPPEFSGINENILSDKTTEELMQLKKEMFIKYALKESNSRMSQNLLDKESTCPICLENFLTKLDVFAWITECEHIFHASCITKNMNHGNLTCPVCRLNIDQ